MEGNINKKSGRPALPKRFKCSFEQLVILRYMVDGSSLIESLGKWMLDDKRQCHATSCSGMVVQKWIAIDRKMRKGGYRYKIINDEAARYAANQWIKNYPGI